MFYKCSHEGKMPGAQNMQLMNALRNNDREMSPLRTKDSLFHRHFHHFGQDYFNEWTRPALLVPKTWESFLCDMWKLFLLKKREICLVFCCALEVSLGLLR